MNINPKLLERIADLQELALEEGELCREESLKDLLTFLETNVKMNLPSLVLTPPGNFRATWGDNDNLLGRYSLEFLGGEKFNLVARSVNNVFSFDYFSNKV